MVIFLKLIFLGVMSQLVLGDLQRNPRNTMYIVLVNTGILVGGGHPQVMEV